LAGKLGISALAQAGLTKTRIEALTDGIFATVMTVLVLGLSLPQVNLSESDLQGEIVKLSPHILAYAFSFIVLGVYWIGHHNQFHYIKRTDRVFLWVNIVFLLTIGFVPFSTSLLGEYPFSPSAVRIYGANLGATGLALYAVWWYATSQYRLVEKDLDPHIVSLAKNRTIIGPIVSLLGIGFSFLDTRISLALYLLLIPFFIRPSHIDIHFRGGSHE
jgi:TMEM175 potassium channel family protein